MLSSKIDIMTLMGLLHITPLFIAQMDDGGFTIIEE